tara:strand:+ start:3019 stop:3195 length:177 start_codon:yes stop_codon:yes gene_type:complete
MNNTYRTKEDELNESIREYNDLCSEQNRKALLGFRLPKLTLADISGLAVNDNNVAKGE